MSRRPRPLYTATGHRDRAGADDTAPVTISGAAGTAHSTHHQASSCYYCLGPGQHYPYSQDTRGALAQ